MRVMGKGTASLRGREDKMGEVLQEGGWGVNGREQS